MTRYTLKRKKEHLEATGEFNVKPLKAPRVFGDPSRASQSSFASGGFKGNNNSLRRDRRQNQKHASTICFACRQTGHAVSQCPQAQNKTTICYTCGSTDHALKACPHKASANAFAFAECFVCNEKGHLASKCPRNSKGLYPNGGSCRYCNATDHLAKDCKPIKKGMSNQIMVGTIDLNQGGDDDDVFLALRRQDRDLETAQKSAATPAATMKPKNKIVKF